MPDKSDLGKNVKVTLCVSTETKGNIMRETHCKLITYIMSWETKSVRRHANTQDAFPPGLAQVLLITVSLGFKANFANYGDCIRETCEFSTNVAAVMLPRPFCRCAMNKFWLIRRCRIIFGMCVSLKFDVFWVSFNEVCKIFDVTLTVSWLQNFDRSLF